MSAGKRERWVQSAAPVVAVAPSQSPLDVLSTGLVTTHRVVRERLSQLPEEQQSLAVAAVALSTFILGWLLGRRGRPESEASLHRSVSASELVEAQLGSELYELRSKVKEMTFAEFTNARKLEVTQRELALVRERQQQQLRDRDAHLSDVWKATERLGSVHEGLARELRALRALEQKAMRGI